MVLPPRRAGRRVRPYHRVWHMLKNWLRKWLGVSDAPAPPPRKGGMFDMSTPMPTAISAEKNWNDSLTTWQQMVVQKPAPKEYARVTAGADGAVTVAMDDFTDAPACIDKSYGLSGPLGLPLLVMDWFARQSFIGYQFCAMLAQHWFISKACSMPGKDAIRNGWELSRGDGEKLDKTIVAEINRRDRQFKTKHNLREAIYWKRVYGIRVIIFIVNSLDPDYYVKPFNPDGITPGSYKGMSQVDPYWIVPELDADAAADPASQHFYEPTYWRINGQRYHRSHLVILKGPEVADILKPTYLYGGLSIPQLLYERVYSATRVADEAPQLAMTKRMTSIEGVDMVAAMANQADFMARVKGFTDLRDNYGIYMLGSQETIKQTDTTLTDFDALIMTQFQLCCAIINVPSTKMLGTQPKGFNATGESEAANYREELESIQDDDLSPILDRHYLCVSRSYIAPKFGTAPFAIEHKWNEVDPETAKEKSDREKQDADRDKALTDSGAIDGIDIRNRMRNDKQSSYYDIEEAMPEGAPEPRSLVQPGAQTTAPNTQPGQTPQPPATPPAPVAAVPKAANA